MTSEVNDRGQAVRGRDGDRPVAARLVDAVSRVQSLVSEQAAPECTYQAVVDGAVDLLGGHSGALRFVDRTDPAWMVAVASHAPAGLGERWRTRAPITAAW
jgi:hypothetical protein